MKGKRRWLSISLVVALVTAGFTLGAGADAGTESEFLSLINSSRASAGLAPLTVDGGLTGHARKHTGDMIAAGEIYHSSEAELVAAAGTGWEKLAENVGRGGTPSSLHKAFMESAGHKKNILGDYNYVGIGTAYDADGRLYVTVVFMKKGSTSGPTTTTAPATTTTTVKSTTTTKAPATTTTSTLPPTTTTTLIVGPDKPVTPGDHCIEATRFWQMCHE